jgi:hypothetical protein
VTKTANAQSNARLRVATPPVVSTSTESDAVRRTGVQVENPASKQQRTDTAKKCSPDVDVIRPHSYWESPETMHLFQPRETDDDVREPLERRIEILQSAIKSFEGLRNVIGGRDSGNQCSANDIFEIRQRSQLTRSVMVPLMSLL